MRKGKSGGANFFKPLISDISHQLKTPLAALNIYNGILADADNMEDARRFVDAHGGTIEAESELGRVVLDKFSDSYKIVRMR